MILILFCSLGQKYRLGKSQQSENCSDSLQEGDSNAFDHQKLKIIIIFCTHLYLYEILNIVLLDADHKEIQSSDGHFCTDINDENGSQINE